MEKDFKKRSQNKLSKFNKKHWIMPSKMRYCLRKKFKKNSKRKYKKKGKETHFSSQEKLK